jgi:small GTP-binding protein
VPQKILEISMKVVIVGDSTVGKTCLLSRLTTGQFNPTNLPTIGAAFQNQIMTTSKGSVTLQLWDTAGQERYRALTPMYYRNAQVIVMVFDLTSSHSFNSLDDWKKDLEGKADRDVQLFLVGTKSDLVSERVVEPKSSRNFANRIGAVDYIETSSKTGAGVTSLFTKVAECTQMKSQVQFDSLPAASDDTGCKC